MLRVTKFSLNSPEKRAESVKTPVNGLIIVQITVAYVCAVKHNTIEEMTLITGSLYYLFTVTVMPSQTR